MDSQQTSVKQDPKRIGIIIAVAAALVICGWLVVKSLQSGGETGTSKTEVVAVIPFSGKGATHGEYFREGLKMYEEDHPDTNLKVTLVDSESNPQKAVSGFKQQLALRKPRAAISLLSPVSGTLAPVAEQSNLLLIGINTAPDSFVNDYTWTQRINDRPADHTAPLARLAAKKHNRVGVIYSDDAFGQFCKTTFETIYHQSNSNDLIMEPFNTADRDQSIVVQRLLSNKPDAVYAAGYGQAYISIFQTLRTFKYDGQVFADIDFSNPQVLEALGDAAEGVVFAAMGFNVTPPSTSQAGEFLQKYMDSFRREPWLGSAFVYDALAIIEHLDRNKQPMDRQTIFKLKEWPGIAAPLSFPTPGECQYEFQFVRRTAGKNVPVDLENL